MTSKKIGFFAVLFTLLCGNLVAQDETRVSATWQVQKYDITATLPQADSDRNLAVKARLDAKNVSSRPASTMTLRISTAADISSVAVNGSAVE